MIVGQESGAPAVGARLIEGISVIRIYRLLREGVQPLVVPVGSREHVRGEEVEAAFGLLEGQDQGGVRMLGGRGRRELAATGLPMMTV